MLLKDIEFEKCPTCGAHRKVLQERVYGCDQCKKTINLNAKSTDWLEVTIFHHNKEADHLQLCSWKCVLKLLPKLKGDYFISLPFLHYDMGSPQTRASAFFKELKNRRK